MQSSLSSSLSRYKVLVVVFILAIATISTLPNYITGSWPWRRVPELTHVQQLKTIQTEGIRLPGWRTLNQQTVEIGGHDWSAQFIAPEAEADNATAQTAVVVLLRPQIWHRDLPEVDWLDIRGAQNWTTDSYHSLQFPIASTAAPASLGDAQFLRAWNERQSYAVLQWYAWAGGGHPSPNRWFWADQWSQWRDRRRTPWIAVSVHIPIPTLSNIDAVQPQAETLATLIQTTLTTQTTVAP